MTFNKKKFLRLTILPLVAVLTLVTSLWPHDTYAIAFPSGWVSTYSTNEVYYRVHDVTNGWQAYRTGTYTDFPNSGFIDGIEFNNTDQRPLVIPENSIWSISFVSENCSFEGTTNNLSNNIGRFMGMDTDTTGYEYVTYYFYNNGPTAQPNVIPLPISVNCQANSRFKATTFYSFVKLDVSEGQIDYTTVLNDIKDGIDELHVIIDNHLLNIEDVTSYVGDAVDRQSDAEQERYDDQQNNVFNAQSDAEIEGDQAQSDAQATGTSLLGVFSSFVNALTNVSPKNNCYLTVDLGHIDFGRLNLCELSPPAEFQFISSLIVIGFSVPVSIMLVKKMISLFRGFA